MRIRGNLANLANLHNLAGIRTQLFVFWLSLFCGHLSGTLRSANALIAIPALEVLMHIATRMRPVPSVLRTVPSVLRNDLGTLFFHFSHQLGQRCLLVRAGAGIACAWRWPADFCACNATIKTEH